MREEQQLRDFEIRVLIMVIGPKTEEVTGEWGRLHKKEIRHPYSSPNIIRLIKSTKPKRAEHVSSLREERGTHRRFVEKPE